MKILFLSPYLPSENSGHAGAQLIFRNLRVLAPEHNIKLITFINRSESASLEQIKKLGIEIFTVLYDRNRRGFMGTMNSLFQNLFPLIKSILGRDIFFIAKYNRKQMKTAIRDVLTTFEPDLVQIEYNVMHHYAGLFKKIPIILIQHDISTKVFERGSTNSLNLSGRKKNKRYYNICGKLEQKLMEKFNRIITLSIEDKLYCDSKWENLPKIEIIPPQVSMVKSHYHKNINEICFIGSFNREPNLQSLELLIEEIFPILKKSIPHINLKIAGSHLPLKFVRRINRIDNMVYAGFVKDINKFVGQSSLLVAPIHIGAGLKMKITHALACGTGVVTTPVGAEGIHIKAKDGLWVENNNKAIAARCIEIMNQPELIKQAGEKGKKAVEKIFSPEVIREKFNNIYFDLVQS